VPIVRTLAALAIAAALALSAVPTNDDEQHTVSAALSSEPVIYQPDPDREAALALRATTTTAPTTTTTHYHPPTTTTLPTPAPAASSNASGDPYSEASWDRLAQCEAGGNWSINTGNGYYGGLQFSLSSWQAVGGTGYPHEHSRATQIAMGQRLHAQGGWKHWPGCSRKFGWL
jgi:hypothetical protein